MPAKPNNSLKRLPLTKMIYPAITLIFAAIVLILFVKTLVFLSTSINKVFSENTASLKNEVPRFDAANYELIRKRFGWPELPAPNSLETPAVPSAVNISSSTAATSSPAKNNDTPQIAAAKAAITIKIFNGPGKNQSGETLQDSLNQAGFTSTKIDSHQLVLKETIVQFKTTGAQLQNYIALIKKIISEKYTVQMGSDLPDNTDYDVSILIGKK
ncbi:MAG: LytR C-terminal domain-containing protein [Patescibacteria group bacterium]|nr:LytR C-terminal domain-containing protein [Patescibacteria group bacterium]